MMNRIAADLGEKNIPKPLVQQIVPGELRALYWREESTSPENVTVEIWGSDTATFYLISGDFGRGQWSQENIQLVGEYKSLDDALRAAKSSFVIQTGEEPTQLAAATNFKRLIRKN